MSSFFIEWQSHPSPPPPLRRLFFLFSHQKLSLWHLQPMLLRTNILCGSGGTSVSLNDNPPMPSLSLALIDRFIIRWQNDSNVINTLSMHLGCPCYSIYLRKLCFFRSMHFNTFLLCNTSNYIPCHTLMSMYRHAIQLLRQQSQLQTVLKFQISKFMKHKLNRNQICTRFRLPVHNKPYENGCTMGSPIVLTVQWQDL